MGDFELFAYMFVEFFHREGGFIDFCLDLVPFWAGESGWWQEEHGAVDCVRFVEFLC